MIKTAKPCVYIWSAVQGITKAINEKGADLILKDVALPPKGGPVPPETLAVLQQAEILVTDPGLLAKHGLVQSLPNLKWLQSTWTGVDSMFKSMDKTKPAPQYQLCKLSGCFGAMMSEYVLGYIIAHERNFRGMYQAQMEKDWRTDLFNSYRQLSCLTLGVLGLGDIGRGVAKMAKGLGMQVWGLVRSVPSPEQRCSFIDEYRVLEELPELLRSCDYVCSILPSTPATVGLLSGSMLAHCKDKKSVLLSIGRGDVMDDQDIIQALDEGWLSHAIVDVFSQEPLSESSALWMHPGVTITPHVSCVSFKEPVAELVVENYKRYLDGEELRYQVSWQHGY